MLKNVIYSGFEISQPMCLSTYEFMKSSLEGQPCVTSSGNKFFTEFRFHNMKGGDDLIAYLYSDRFIFRQDCTKGNKSMQSINDFAKALSSALPMMSGCTLDEVYLDIKIGADQVLVDRDSHLCIIKEKTDCVRAKINPRMEMLKLFSEMCIYENDLDIQLGHDFCFTGLSLIHKDKLSPSLLKQLGGGRYVDKKLSRYLKGGIKEERVPEYMWYDHAAEYLQQLMPLFEYNRYR